MATWKSLMFGRGLLLLLLALAPVFVTGCSSTSGARASDGHVGHSH